MFLRRTIRKKDGKEHRYFSVVENKRVARGRVVQRHVLYLGEINDTQELAWRRSVEVFEEGTTEPRTLSLFPEDRCEGLLPDASIVRLNLSRVRLCRPRQWGACWLALALGREVRLDRVVGGAARARAGMRFCSCWWRTDCWHRGASGVCTVSGSNAARFRTCWAPTSPSPRSPSFTPVTTGCSRTSRRCSITWSAGGGICSTPASTCCCTT